MKTRTLIPLLFFPLTLLLSAEARIWTNSKNQEAEGTLLTATETEAVIHFKGQKASKSVKLNTLSEKDREYVADFLNNGGKTDSSGGGKKQNTDEIPDNFDDPWPKLVKSPEGVTVDLVEENEEEGRYVYHSANYEFICDVPLKKHLVQKFAVLFEGTRELCRVLPIFTKKAHLTGGQFRNKILLFETKNSYYQNGGPPGSGGVFMSGGSRGNVVMVPLTSLGVKKLGSSYTVDYGESNKTLPHELAHQLTDRFYYAKGARGWFSEGLAEYVGVTPYRSGNFSVSKTLRAAKDYATEYGREGNGGRALGDDINAPGLKKYMLQDYGSFTSNSNFNYGLGLLITTYFFEIEGKGDRVAITAFLKALREGKQGEEALKELLQGRTYNELSKDISKGWKSRGVTINFANSPE